MARRKRKAISQGARGLRGMKGAPGPPGLQGPVGPPALTGDMIVQLGNVFSRVTQELEDVQRTLRVQFTRIAELQAEIDEFRRAIQRSN